MAKISTDRVKYNPPLGNLPALQYLLPQQLQIDETYQRTIDSPASQGLIRKIAAHWNWDLCQPLVVARREAGELFVIDGQHRLEAARLRGDIAQLPAVVVHYASVADEAASFVHLNQQRTPLKPLQIFHAALASGDSTALAIEAAIAAAGLHLSRSSQLETPPPMTINNVGGLLRMWQRVGPGPAAEALQVLAAAFAGRKLIYAGTLYPGLAAICAREMKPTGTFEPGRFALFTARLGAQPQMYWRRRILEVKVANPTANFIQAGDLAMSAALPISWPIAEPRPAPIAASAPKPAAKRVAWSPPPFDLEGKGWCTQCEQRCHKSQVSSCASPFCALKAKIAA